MKAKPARSRRTFDILQIQQQISHYNHLIQVKPQVSTSPLRSPVAKSSRLKNKLYNQVERQRLLDNSKLVRRLTEIKHTKGLLNEANYRQRSVRETNSLQNQFKLLEGERERLRMNQMLLTKLKTAKPMIGNHTMWNDHFEQYQTNQRKLSRVNPELVQLEDRFYHTYADLAHKKPKSRHKFSSSSARGSFSQKKPCQNCIQGRSDEGSRVLHEAATQPLGLQSHAVYSNEQTRKIKRKRRNRRINREQSQIVQHITEASEREESPSKNQGRQSQLN